MRRVAHCLALPAGDAGLWLASGDALGTLWTRYRLSPPALLVWCSGAGRGRGRLNWTLWTADNIIVFRWLRT